MSRRTLAGLLVFGVGMLLLPATAEASVNVGWSPQTSPGTFDYGTVQIGQTPGKTFHLTNTGSATTPVLRIRVAGSSAFKKMRDTCSGQRIAPTKGCLIRIQYTPATDGQTDTTVISANNRTLSATYASITITGTGASPGTADLEWTDTATGQPVTSYDFGTTAGSHEFTLTNIGTAAAYINVLDLQDYGALSPDQFCSGVVFQTDFAPGASCTETWTFDPTHCPFSGQIIGYDSVDTYFVDSTHTTTAGPVELDLSATCP